MSYQRVLLKLSGEAFAGDGALGVDPDVVASLARQIGAVVAEGVEVAIVIGGGNFFEVPSCRCAAWIARAPTTWACSAQS